MMKKKSSSKTKARRINLDISRAEFNEEGVKDYYWPIPIDASDPVRMHLYRELVNLVKNADESPLGIAMRLSYRRLLFDLLVLYEASLLLNAFRSDGVIFVAPEQLAPLNRLAEGEIPMLTWEPVLEHGPPLGRTGPVWLKRLVRDFQWNGFNPRLFLPFQQETQVMAPENNRLMVKHARLDGRLLRFIPYAAWFKPMLPGSLAAAGQAQGPIVDRVTELVCGLAWPGDTISRRLLKEWIMVWLGRAETFITYHLNHLRALKTGLPEEAWFGAAGSSIWSIMLSQVVRENGGIVVSHEHGQGGAQHDYKSQIIGDDINLSDVIYTYNYTQLAMLRHQLSEDSNNSNIPRIESQPLKPESNGFGAQSRILRYPKRIKTIMYVATAYHGMRLRGRPIIPDLVALDMQARLFGKLKSWGIDVVHKPHPEGASKAPNGFAESFGFRTEFRRFEAVDTEVDAYLTDFLFSSTTPRILMSNKPILHLNLPYPRMAKRPLDLIKQRCCFIDVWMTKENRIEVDWEGLYQALRRDSHEWSMRFPDTYYAGI